MWPRRHSCAPGENPGTSRWENRDEIIGLRNFRWIQVQLRLIRSRRSSHDRDAVVGEKSKQCYRLGRRCRLTKRIQRRQHARWRWTADGLGHGDGNVSGLHRFPGTCASGFYADGDGIRAVGAAASQDSGTGTWTIGTQMTADLTGLPIERAKFELGIRYCRSRAFRVDRPRRVALRRHFPRRPMYSKPRC